MVDELAGGGHAGRGQHQLGRSDHRRDPEASVKIYLGATYSRRGEMRDVRDDLVVMGYGVTSTWVDDHALLGDGFGVPQLMADPDAARLQALRDAAQLAAADTMISFTDGLLGRGGRHVEFGMAYAWEKRLIVVGPREHVFHMLYPTEVYPDWSTLHKTMATWARDMRDAPDMKRGI